MPSIIPNLTSRYLCEEALDSDQLADSIGSLPSTNVEGSPNALGTARSFDGGPDAIRWDDTNKPIDSGAAYTLYFDFKVTNVYSGILKRFWRSVDAGAQGPFLDWNGTSNSFVFTTHAAANSSTATAATGALTLDDRIFVGISYDFTNKVPRIVVKSTGGFNVSATGAVAVANSISNTSGHQLFKLSESNRTQADLNEIGADSSAFASIGDLQDTADFLFNGVPPIQGGVGRPSFRLDILRQTKWNRGTRRFV